MGSVTLHFVKKIYQELKKYMKLKWGTYCEWLWRVCIINCYPCRIGHYGMSSVIHEPSWDLCFVIGYSNTCCNEWKVWKWFLCGSGCISSDWMYRILCVTSLTLSQYALILDVHLYKGAMCSIICQIKQLKLVKDTTLWNSPQCVFQFAYVSTVQRVTAYVVSVIAQWMHGSIFWAVQWGAYHEGWYCIQFTSYYFSKRVELNARNSA